MTRAFASAITVEQEETNTIAYAELTKVDNPNDLHDKLHGKSIRKPVNKAKKCPLSLDQYLRD